MQKDLIEAKICVKSFKGILILNHLVHKVT